MDKVRAYASYFVSYLLSELNGDFNIGEIILFGSAARGETTRGSDVDIFIEEKKENKRFEEKIKKITENFYKSREALIFKSRGVDNKLNVILGKLKNWKELKDNIESYGIILFGSYIPRNVSGRKYVIISWNRIGKNRGAFLNKIYGVKIKGKRYSGLLENSKGKKLGKSTIMIPVENRKEFFDLMKKYEVDARVIEVYHAER